MRRNWPFWKEKRSLSGWTFLKETVVIRRESSILISYLRTNGYDTRRCWMAVFCVVCFLFGSKEEGVLMTSPFTDWSNIGSVMEKHQKSVDHVNASQCCISFTSIASGKQQSVYQSILSAYQETIRRNRHVLGEIVKVIVLCGRQNIPLDGHIPERSNFHSILNLLCEHDPILDNFLEASPRHAQYISPQIQN